MLFLKLPPPRSTRLHACPVCATIQIKHTPRDASILNRQLRRQSARQQVIAARRRRRRCSTTKPTPGLSHPLSPCPSVRLPNRTQRSVKDPAARAAIGAAASCLHCANQSNRRWQLLRPQRSRCCSWRRCQREQRRAATNSCDCDVVRFSICFAFSRFVVVLSRFASTCAGPRFARVCVSVAMCVCV